MRRNVLTLVVFSWALRVAVAILLAATPASAIDCTRRVAPGGSDDASGSPSAPWATLQHAVDSANAGDV
ncbi:MAG TPA: pectate lyase, partial [Alphaproteobacteria bacterium]|nr:pectate lyase [Alphaproteobacteria bacterium]